MKLWVFVGSSLFTLVLFAFVLLHWHQAPLALLAAKQDTTQTDSLPSQISAAPTKAPSEVLPILSTEEFRALGAELMKGLPSRGEMQKQRVKDDFFAADPILETAERLQRLVRATRQEPGLELEALVVAQGCATSEEVLDFARALCFSTYRSLSKKMKRSYKDSIVPQSVRELAERLES